MDIRIYIFGALYFLFVAVLIYVLMGIELLRKGKNVPFLQFGLSYTKIKSTLSRVFEEYRQLKKSERQRTLFPVIFHAVLGLTVLCVCMIIIIYFMGTAD